MVLYSATKLCRVSQRLAMDCNRSSRFGSLSVGNEPDWRLILQNGPCFSIFFSSPFMYTLIVIFKGMEHISSGKLSKKNVLNFQKDHENCTPRQRVTEHALSLWNLHCPHYIKLKDVEWNKIKCPYARGGEIPQINFNQSYTNICNHYASHVSISSLF